MDFSNEEGVVHGPPDIACPVLGEIGPDIIELQAVWERAVRCVRREMPARNGLALLRNGSVVAMYARSAIVRSRTPWKRPRSMIPMQNITTCDTCASLVFG